MREDFKPSVVVPLLQRRPVLFSIGLTILVTFVLNGTISFLPTFLVNHRDRRDTLFGLLRGQDIFQLLVDHVSDEYGRDLALGLCMITSVGGLELFGYGPGFTSVLATAALAGLGVAYFPTLDSRFLDVIGKDEKGSEFGLVRTVYIMIGSTESIGIGLLADLYGWLASFTFLIALSSLVVVALAATGRST